MLLIRLFCLPNLTQEYNKIKEICPAEKSTSFFFALFSFRTFATICECFDPISVQENPECYVSFDKFYETFVLFNWASRFFHYNFKDAFTLREIS